MIAIIAAADEHNVIGNKGAMPWRGQLPADMRHFASLTTGHTVIMGRATYESIGRPLPRRRNLVLSRSGFIADPGVEVVPGLEEALAVAGTDDAFVIGGSAVYAAALPYADTIYLTRIHAAFPGDRFFPDIPAAQWHEVSRETHEPDEHNQHRYSFITYRRN